MAGFLKQNFLLLSEKKIRAFFLCAVLLFSIHGVQCRYRYYGHRVFSELFSLQSQKSNSEELNSLWNELHADANIMETVFFTVGILFFVWVSYEILTSRITVNAVLSYTLAVYGIGILIFLPIQLHNPDIVDLADPIYLSFAISLIQIFAAWLVKKKFGRRQRLLEEFNESKT